MKLTWLGQRFGFRIPRTSVSPAQYLVQAYKYVNRTWTMMPEYTKFYPSTEYVGAYFNELCAKGRALAPDRVRTSTTFSSTVRNVPVIVKMFRMEGGTWVVDRECVK